MAYLIAYNRVPVRLPKVAAGLPTPRSLPLVSDAGHFVCRSSFRACGTVPERFLVR